jgi:Family of unknown function (DUF6166)
MKTYIGIHTETKFLESPKYKDLRILDGMYAVVVEQPGRDPYVLPDCTEVINHSPTGFCWGYNGSGPAQLALALLIDCLGDVYQAKLYYQRFKLEVITRFSMNADWLMTEHMIESVITQYKIEGN